MTVNVKLFQAVVDAIHNDPKSHDQTAWAVKTPCGTSYCFAGWAVVLSGDEIIWSNLAESCSCDVCQEWESSGWCRDSDGEVHYISDRARELLGIDDDWYDLTEAQRNLFSGSNSVHDLHCYVKDITEGKVTGPSL